MSDDGSFQPVVGPLSSMEQRQDEDSVGELANVVLDGH